MTYKFVADEDITACYGEEGLTALCSRLLSERDAYREVAFCRFNDLDDATVYAHVDAEAARIMEGK